MRTIPVVRNGEYIGDVECCPAGWRKLEEMFPDDNIDLSSNDVVYITIEE